ncbi:uncharacterized protein EV422DRAFT_614836 [Fimicolochytrium jonesii]|uniref:uncharacterized protein n=1 Tax=Fimicolochytrium jonesii TaxID=1396493 RepID=UPI0022FDD4C0|nr:uncharacterized protein EV422DRAFT_614836 [Fimicolochytrium jonesii]KAI8821619.1 hypothetical protein EV422DRAFT_614836 [Fimicolochytrium jonesii]
MVTPNTQTRRTGDRQPHRSTQDPQNASATNSLDDGSLKVKKAYPQELSSLKQLFGDWSEADLLALLEETQGDLDVAISRITEGVAEQWGEVKKRDKKDKPKQSQPIGDSLSTRGNRSSKPGPPSRDGFARDNNRPARGGTYASRGGRGGSRGGRGGGRGGAMVGGSRGGRHQNGGHGETEAAPASEWDSAPADAWGTATGEQNEESKSKDEAPGTADDWAAVPTDQADTWSAETPSDKATGWATSIKPTQPKPATKSEAKPATGAEAKPDLARSTPAAKPPTSWAALLKTAEKVPTPTPTPARPAPPKEVPRAKSPVKPVPESPKSVSERARSPSPVKSLAKEVIEEKTKTPEPKSPVHAPIARPQSRSSSPLKPPTAEERVEEQTSPALKTSAPPGLKAAAPKPAPFTGRKLKQDAAVVMPSSASKSTLGVQFGSLRLGGSADEEDLDASALDAPEAPQSNAAQNVSQTIQQGQSQHQSQVSHGQQPGARDTRPTNAPGLQQGAAKQNDVAQSNPGPAAPGLTNGGVGPYGSYFPTQQLAAASGFGLGHMGQLPAEYSALYGSDAQARAAMMHGYYDPSIYQQGAATKYQGQDTASAQPGTQGGQASPSASLHQGTQQQQQQQQQGYPLPYPYYPYYHMPNQFQSYQSSPYGQPFGNKSVYPGYPQQSQQPTASATTSSKPSSGGNVGYGGYSTGGQQHLQSQQLPGQHQPHLYQQGGYDELTSGLGGHDYKNYSGLPQQGYQGFGLHQQSLPAQNKPGQPSSGTAGGASQQDYKPQQASRPPRQQYEHKYQNTAAGVGSQPSGVGSGNASNSALPSQSSGSYYNQQQQFGGLHGQQQQQHQQQQHGQQQQHSQQHLHQQPHVPAQNPYLQMHQQYQGAGGLYGGGGRQQGSGAGQSQQQGYWNGQS